MIKLGSQVKDKVSGLVGIAVTRYEVVHHINFNTTDNRIENLKLFANSKTHNTYHKKIRRDEIRFPEEEYYDYLTRFKGANSASL